MQLLPKSTCKKQIKSYSYGNKDNTFLGIVKKRHKLSYLSCIVTRNKRKEKVVVCFINRPYEITMEKKKKCNMYKLLLANAITEIGGNMYKFALAMYVLNRSSSSLLYSVIVVCGILPNVLLGIFSGIFVDRHNKKKVMAYSNLLSGVFVGIFMLLFKIQFLGLGIFAAYSFIIGVFQTYSNSAMNGSTPELVLKENVSKTNSLMQACDSMITICGPIMGAVAYLKFGMVEVMIIDSISFIIGFALIQSMYYEYKTDNKQLLKASDLKKDFSAIIEYIKQEKIIFFFLGMALTINLVYYPIRNSVITYLSYNILNLSEINVSFIQAATGVGTILGALTIIFFKKSNIILKRFFVLLAAQGVLILALIIPGVVVGFTNIQITVIYFVIMMLIGLLNVMQNLPLITYFQVATPEKLRGRLFSVFTTSLLLFTPLGMLIYGVVLNDNSWMVVLVVSGLILITLCIFGKNHKIFKKFVLSLEEE